MNSDPIQLEHEARIGNLENGLVATIAAINSHEHAPPPKCDHVCPAVTPYRYPVELFFLNLATFAGGVSLWLWIAQHLAPR